MTQWLVIPWFVTQGDPLGFGPTSLTPRFKAPADDSKISRLATAVKEESLKTSKVRNLVWIFEMEIVYQIMHLRMVNSVWISGSH